MTPDRTCVLAMQHRRKAIPLVNVYLAVLMCYVYLAVICITCNCRNDLFSDADYCYIKFLICVARVQKNHDYNKCYLCRRRPELGQRLLVVVIHQYDPDIKKLIPMEQNGYQIWNERHRNR